MKFKPFLLIAIFFFYFPINAQQKSNIKNVAGKFDEVLNQIARTYGVSIAFDAEKTHKLNVAISYELMPIEQVLDKLTKSVHMEVLKVNEVFIIRPLAINKIDISAKIEDISSSEPLPYALVSLTNNPTIFSTTNTQGIFSFLEIPDTSVIQISYLGYKDTLISVQNINATISLTPDSNLLKEVIINNQRSNTILYGEETSKIAFNPSSLDKLPVLGSNDVFRTLQLLPGISGTDETSSGLVVRGSSPDKNLVLLDGYSLYHVDHFYGIYSAFNSKAIKSIQLYKGNFSAKYGGRSSSVMVLTAKDGNKKKFSGDIGANFIDFNGVLELALSDKLTLIAAGRRSITNIIENYLFKELFNKGSYSLGDINNTPILDFNKLKPNFSFGDLNIKLSYQPNRKDHIAISSYGSYDNLKYQYKNLGKLVSYTTSEKSIWGNLGISTIWSRQWNKKLSTETQIAYSAYYSNTKLSSLHVFSDKKDLSLRNVRSLEAQNNSVNDITLKIDCKYLTPKNEIFNFGIANTYNTISLLSTVDKKKFPIFNQKGNQFQFYGEYNIFITPKIESKFGLRGNYYNLTNTIYWEPKINLKYTPFSWINIKSSWAINNQMISRILRLDLSTKNPDFWVLADNNNIPVIHSEHWATGIHLKFSIISINIEGYLTNTFREAKYLPSLRRFETENIDSEQLYTSGNTISKGMEVMIERGINNYSGWISYSLSNSLNYFDELNAGKPFPSRFDQRHELKLVNMYNIGRWNFSLIWIYGTGKPYSEPEGNRTLPTSGGSNTINNIAYSKINNKRLPPYHRLDLSGTYNFNLGRTKAKVGLSIFNVYNRENIKYRRFSKISFDTNSNPLSTKKYISSDILLLGITPSLFFNWRF